MKSSVNPPPAPRPVGLYVHIPFCRSRCSYCAFASGIYTPHTADIYIDTLAREISLRPLFNDRCKPETLFIGGGTPSSLDVKQLEKLLLLLPKPVDGGEATCELNPDSTDIEKLTLLHAHGINRCSFGVQTFSEKGLRLLGRRHDAGQAETIIRKALEMGFSSVSLDLITGWPGQSIGDALFDVRQAVALGVTHISCYNLSIDNGSEFYEKLTINELMEPTEERLAEFWEMVEGYLLAQGFEHYETSNFCRPGFACRHNVNTWKGGEYLGIGAAAHSHHSGRRWATTPSTSEYISNLAQGMVPEVFSEQLEPEEKAKECAAFWLRLFDGIDIQEFAERTGFDIFSLYGETLDKLCSQGYVEINADQTKVFVPKKYQLLLDSIVVDLI